MADRFAELTPAEAWGPLPGPDWNFENALHLLRRAGFSAKPEQVEKALESGLETTVRELFGDGGEMTKTESLDGLGSEIRTLRQRLRATGLEEKKREIRREIRRQQDAAFDDLVIAWLRHARRPENSAQEKFVLFLQDIFVVARQKVRDPARIYRYQATLREGLDDDYADLCKAMSRDPAMMRYLDLDRSTREKPNENFARELFELFTLGEGHYTEADIKEAARAFTGYRTNPRSGFTIRRDIADRGKKTVFGRTGNYDGDDVIELVFRQPASRTFLVTEMMRFYLGEPPPPAYAEALGNAWADQRFELRWLVERFFQSRLFYAPAYHGNTVKSPVHFYLGLCQDLSLDVVPFPRHLRPAFRGMGQDLFNPPNVRGWLYGPHWINSSTITARRGVVDYLFDPVEDKNLNGDEEKALETAAAEGRGTVTLPTERLETLLSNPHLSDHIERYLFAANTPRGFRETARDALEKAQERESTEDLAACLRALLQSPAYNLC